MIKPTRSVGRSPRETRLALGRRFERRKIGARVPQSVLSLVRSRCTFKPVDFHAVTTDVDSLRKLVVELDAELRLAWESLGTFWNQDQTCFSTSDPTIDRVNVTSTCFAMIALELLPEAKKLFYAVHLPKTPAEVDVEIRDALLGAPWDSGDLPNFNPYTTPIALAGVLRLGAKLTDATVRRGITELLRATNQGGVAYPEYPRSGFLTYWASKALSEVHQRARPTKRDLSRKALERIHEWAEAEIHRQIASMAIGDIASFDPNQLAYCGAIYAAGETNIGTKPRSDVLSHAINAVFSAQLSNGLWPKGQPIFHIDTRGSVYSFTFEMLDVLLGLPESVSDLLTPYLPQLRTSLQWAKDNFRINPTTGTTGWRSNHLVFAGGPEVWSTATVFSALMRVRSLASQALNSAIAIEFLATPYVRPDSGKLDSLYDSRLTVRGHDRSLHTVINDHFLAPRLSEPSAVTAPPKYSAVLFGPPGTAKTSIADAVAAALGWSFFHIQTGHFLEDGNERVAARARRMFAQLGLLESAVVLFDEIEEFILRREREETATASKLMTTSMLTLIQQLRRERKVIFFVATNRLREIDPAIMRQGRFDMVLLVQPPSLRSKRSHLERAMRSRAKGDGLSEETIESILAVAEDYVTRQFPSRLRYFAFSEWVSLVDEIVRVAVRERLVSEQTLDRIVRSREKDLLIQGEVRRVFEECERESIIY